MYLQTKQYGGRNAKEHTPLLLETQSVLEDQYAKNRDHCGWRNIDNREKDDGRDGSDTKHIENKVGTEDDTDGHNRDNTGAEQNHHLFLLQHL